MIEAFSFGFTSQTCGRYKLYVNLDALPEELEQPRFTVELTSDAFEEPFIIRDNSVPEGRDGQYYDVGGIYQTFRSEQEAQKYADRLNGKETFEQPQMTSETSRKTC